MSKTSPTRILMPVATSDAAETKFRFFFELSSGLESHVTLLSVIDPDTLGEDEQTAIDTDGGRERIERPYLDSLTKLADSVEYERSKLEALVRIGRPAGEIIRQAEDGFNLIAMFTHARGAIQRSFLGSVTDEVIRHSSIPIITAAPSSLNQLSERLETLIVPLDGSSTAESALRPAGDLALNLDLKVILVRSADHAGTHTPVSAAFLSIADDVDMEEMSDRRMQPYLDDKAQALSERGITVATRILRGSATFQIAEVAHETTGSMVVMTTHGRSGFRRLVIGSVTDAVIRNSGRPVMVIPPAS